MLSLAVALLLGAPAQPADTWKGVICVHDIAHNTLVGSDTFYSYGAAQVWIVGPDALTAVNQDRLVQAKGRPFYVNGEPVALGTRTFKKYGLPRVLKAAELEPRPVAVKNGVPFYAAKGDAGADVVYALSQAVGCEFQPYAAS